jgi:inhibitor of cysteine peptidase
VTVTIRADGDDMNDLHRHRPLTRTVAASAVAALALLGACSSSDDSSGDTSSTTTTSSTSTTASEGTVITSPGAVELAVGERATLELEANPTTGYQWEPSAEPDAAVVKVVSDTYVAGGSDAMGAGGTQRIVVEGVAAGTTTLELRYVRPWESDTPPAETASYQITVS